MASQDKDLCNKVVSLDHKDKRRFLTIRLLKPQFLTSFQEKELKKLQLMKHHYQDMLLKIGEKNSGTQGHLDQSKYGKQSDKHVKKIMRLLKQS